MYSMLLCVPTHVIREWVHGNARIICTRMYGILIAMLFQPSDLDIASALAKLLEDNLEVALYM